MLSSTYAIDPCAIDTSASDQAIKLELIDENIVAWVALGLLEAFITNPS